jgi:ferredoxin/flavodoxin---NADP+ reductase
VQFVLSTQTANLGGRATLTSPLITVAALRTRSPALAKAAQPRFQATTRAANDDSGCPPFWPRAAFCYARRVKPPVGTDVERRLRLSALARQRNVADPELGAILSLVASRRGARSPATIASASTPLAPSNAAAGTVLATTLVGPDIAILQVARPSGFSFQAGQAVKLGVGAGASRSYTVASAPSDAHLEFCIERIVGGSVSPRLTSLSPGARVELGSAPKGSLTFEPGAALHVMLATATGIAPFRSMLRELFASSNPSARVLLIHGSSYADRLPYAEELTALAAQHPNTLRYVTTISRPGEPRNQGWTGAVGRVDALLAEQLPALSGAGSAQVYACGNSGMIAATEALCSVRGIAFKSEAFD